MSAFDQCPDMAGFRIEYVAEHCISFFEAIKGPQNANHFDLDTAALRINFRRGRERGESSFEILALALASTRIEKLTNFLPILRHPLGHRIVNF